MSKNALQLRALRVYDRVAMIAGSVGIAAGLLGVLWGIS